MTFRTVRAETAKGPENKLQKPSIQAFARLGPELGFELALEAGFAFFGDVQNTATRHAINRRRRSDCGYIYLDSSFVAMTLHILYLTHL